MSQNIMCNILKNFYSRNNGFPHPHNFYCCVDCMIIFWACKYCMETDIHNTKYFQKWINWNNRFNHTCNSSSTTNFLVHRSLFLSY